MRQIGNWRLDVDQCIGKGTHGCVYECKRLDKQGSAAMKFIDCSGDKERQYLNEINLMEKIHALATTNPELDVKAVRYIDSGPTSSPGINYYVQTLVTGGNMREYYRDKDASEEICKPVFRDIANYIYLCNINQIYHNDINLDNVMIDPSTPPRAYVIDLGLATDHQDGLTTEHKDGIWRYIPPDADSTHPRDIWAFGILVAETLLGFYEPPAEMLSYSEEYKTPHRPAKSYITKYIHKITTNTKVSRSLTQLLKDILEEKLTEPVRFKTRIDTWYEGEEEDDFDLSFFQPQRVPAGVLDQSVAVGNDQRVGEEYDEYDIDQRFRAQHEKQGTCSGSSCGARFINWLGWGGRKRTQKKRTRKTPRTRRKRTRRKRTRRKRTRKTPRTRRR